VDTRLAVIAIPARQRFRLFPDIDADQILESRGGIEAGVAPDVDIAVAVRPDFSRRPQRRPDRDDRFVVKFFKRTRIENVSLLERFALVDVCVGTGVVGVVGETFARIAERQQTGEAGSRCQQ
jgi:hypothetical protein